MTHYLSRIATQLSTFALLASIALAAPAAGPGGQWKGAIILPAGQLEIIVELSEADGEIWSGTIDIPAQGLRGFALSGIGVEGTRVQFEMAGIPGQPSFDGELSGSGESIDGKFRQGPQTFPFSLQRAATDGEGERSEEIPVAVPGEGAAGEWLGALDVGPTKLRLALQVVESEDGGFTAILDSIDQGTKIPIAAVAFDERVLRFTIPGIGASYAGTLTPDGSALQGTWAQGGQELPLIFHRQETAFALNRPQHPQPPFPYQIREVTFQSEAGDVRLAGTLIVPAGEGPFPAVAMVTGSGPQDRDETILGHKPFLVIADYLARRGVASLRWDDRGAGESGGDHFGSTVGDFAADTRAALAFLGARPEVDGSAIGIVGHSEGGLIAPMVAAADESVAFLVLLAPPGEPMVQLLTRQSGDLLRLMQVEEKLIERALKSQAADLELIADSSLTSEQLSKKLRERAELRREQFTAAERAQLRIDSNSMDASIQISTTPWFRSLMRQDPAEYLRGVTIPVLALFGEKDFQVDASVNAEAVGAALADAGNSDYEVQILPRLNHLFQHAETGGIEEYGVIEETFAPSVLEQIGDWIRARFPRPAGATVSSSD